MALVPKAAMVFSPASVGQTRAGPPTRVASFSPSVEPLYANAGPSFNPAAFGFANTEEGRSFADREANRRSRQNAPGVFNAPSQTFAAILEGGDQFFSGGDGNVRSHRFGGLVSKAIEIYETNAKVVTGTNNVLGTSVSLVL